MSKTAIIILISVLAVLAIGGIVLAIVLGGKKSTEPSNATLLATLSNKPASTATNSSWMDKGLTTNYGTDGLLNSDTVGILAKFLSK